jgi:hypothetical protein
MSLHHASNQNSKDYFLVLGLPWVLPTGSLLALDSHFAWVVGELMEAVEARSEA